MAPLCTRIKRHARFPHLAAELQDALFRAGRRWVPELERLTSRAVHVAFVLHGIAANVCKTLKRNENACNKTAT
jgi:hypothetical protein